MGQCHWLAVLSGWAPALCRRCAPQSECSALGFRERVGRCRWLAVLSGLCAHIMPTVRAAPWFPGCIAMHGVLHGSELVCWMHGIWYGLGRGGKVGMRAVAVNKRNILANGFPRVRCKP